MIYFTADTHFGHKNIIKYCHRPFTDVDCMDRALIDNWNATVEDSDTIYILGDFAFGNVKNYLAQLKGEKILVPGNHDRRKTFKHWPKVTERLCDITYDNQLILLSHYPMLVWDESHVGSWQLYGHVHGTLGSMPSLLSMDVGVDCNNYKPISFEEIKNIMAQKTYVPWVKKLPGYKQLVEDFSNGNDEG